MSLINDALKRARQAQKRPAISPSAEGTLIAPPSLQPVEDVGRETSQRLLVVLPVLLLSLGASFWFLWKWKNAEAKAADSVRRPELTEVQSASTAKTNALARASATMTQWQERQQSVSLEPPTEGKTSAPTEAQKTRAYRTEALLGNESTGATNILSSGSISPGSAPVALPIVGGLASSAATAGTTRARPNAASSANGVSSGGPSSVTSAEAPALATVALSRPPQALIPVPTTEAPPEVKLQGIFYRLKRPTAVINGRIVSVGDDINGYRVARIERDTVKLAGAGGTNTLTLH